MITELQDFSLMERVVFVYVPSLITIFYARQIIKSLLNGDSDNTKYSVVGGIALTTGTLILASIYKDHILWSLLFLQLIIMGLAISGLTFWGIITALFNKR
jgi:hypothetical protein